MSKGVAVSGVGGATRIGITSESVVHSTDANPLLGIHMKECIQEPFLFKCFVSKGIFALASAHSNSRL